MALAIGQPPPEATLDLMLRFRPDMFMTSPSYMAALTRHAERAGQRPPLTALVLDGEILTSSQTERFKNYWGQVEITNGYGLTEVGAVAWGLPNCDALHLNRFSTLAEIVDPHTLRPADEGELLVTSLSLEAMPLLRYRTGDRVSKKTCRCGWAAPAIHVHGRMGDELVVADSNLHGALVAQALAELEGMTGSVELIVDHVEHVDRLRVRAGIRAGQGPGSQAVMQKLFALYPDLEELWRARGYQLELELVDDLVFSPKPLRVRDLRS
jgi:phenylacetate-CoA ligase